MSPVTEFAKANGIEIAYETFGERSARPLVLIMGLGAQMIAWPEELCASLAARGLFVIRFDNRDAGLSTHFKELAAVSPIATVLGRARPPYRLEDMADDTAGLLGAMGLDSAHVAGASMGGFIAQTFALGYPERVRSLGLIMTSTGSRLVGRPRAHVAARLARRRPVLDREAAIDTLVDTSRLIGSSAYPFDEARRRDLAGRGYDRAYDPGGYLRQFAAITAQRDRTQDLARVAVPTVVMHGLADPLVSVSGGRSLARAIPGARFVGFPGMGHDLPEPLWPRFADEIERIAAAGEAKRGSADR